MILGLYYVSLEREGMPGEGKIFGTIDEVQHALDAGEVHLHTKITARITQIDEEGNEVLQRFETTRAVSVWARCCRKTPRRRLNWSTVFCGRKRFSRSSTPSTATAARKSRSSSATRS